MWQQYQGQLPLNSGVSNVAPIQGTQVTESENHPIWLRLAYRNNLTLEDVSGFGDSLSDYGGAFSMRKQYVAPPWEPVRAKLTSPYDTQRPPFRRIYDGPIFGWTSPTFPPFASSSDSDMAGFGTKAIAACAPTNGIAQLGVALSEVYRDGLPKSLGITTWEKRLSKLKDYTSSAGEEFLNIAFGWKPLASDVRDISNAVVNLDRLMEQYVRDSGKVVRRRYSFPPVVKEERTVVVQNTSAGMEPSALNFYDPNLLNKGQMVRYRSTRVSRWFSGAFTYYCPPSWRDGFVGHVSRARKLLGLDLTPEVLWNLAPWSWAVDWFVNVGDILHVADATANDGLVLRYGYIMEHSVVRDTYQFEGPSGLWASFGAVYPAPVTLVSECKLRRKAGPFGFGITTGLTNQQAAIVAALGMTRA